MGTTRARSRAVIAVLAALLLAAEARAQEPRLERRPAAKAGEGIVIAAPHPPYDAHTDLLAREIAAGTPWGWAVAHGWRSAGARRHVNVNRPTEEPYEGDRRGKEQETERAREVHQRYLASLLEAGARERAPLDLLVEIHGQTLRPGAIEMVAVGFSEAAQRRFKERWGREKDVVRLVVWPLEREYEYKGKTVRFHFTAGGARRAGSLQPSFARAALHVELPPEARASEARARHAAALRGLVQEALALLRAEPR